MTDQQTMPKMDCEVLDHWVSLAQAQLAACEAIQAYIA